MCDGTLLKRPGAEWLENSSEFPVKRPSPELKRLEWLLSWKINCMVIGWINFMDDKAAIYCKEWVCRDSFKVWIKLLASLTHWNNWLIADVGVCFTFTLSKDCLKNIFLYFFLFYPNILCNETVDKIFLFLKDIFFQSGLKWLTFTVLERIKWTAVSSCYMNLLVILTCGNKVDKWVCFLFMGFYR